MDFIDQLKQFSGRVLKLKDTIPTEEATKMSLIVPFFQILGYDVFNPDEFMPEYTADVGIKKGEKVDYAILNEGKPRILVECKWCGDSINKHASQLFRYFGTSEAKFGILTNGIQYNFYTDLDEANKMDLTPFLVFDILDVKTSIVSELKKFHKDNFDEENIFSTASELKYSKAVKTVFSEQLKEPNDEFVKYFLSEVYDGVKTQNVIDKYKGIIKKALNEHISELMNDKITAALQNESAATKSDEINLEAQDSPVKESKIITTEEEIESYYIIKSMLAEYTDINNISYKDNERYLAILYKGNTRKPICRLNLDTKQMQILIPDEDKNFERSYIESINDLYSFKEQLVCVLNRYTGN